MNVDFLPTTKWVLLAITLWYSVCCNEHIGSEESDDIFTNTWVVEVHDGHGEEGARQIADEHGFSFISPVGSLPNHFIFESKDLSKRSRRSADIHHQKLSLHKNVLYAEQQKLLSRKKRGFDPLFNNQWYLKNTGQTRSRCSQYHGFEALDINVEPVWKKNITGRGVVVSILDDGLEHVHPDLQKNYEPLASFDFNGNKKDPMPRYTEDRINKHGTRCAGEVAAEKDNGVCGSGVAYNARVGGIRMLDGEVTDAVEAGSLSYAPNVIDIYSSSWGPDDDGKTVDGPGPLAKKAFLNGVKNGRKGRGSIFVWATGNGGRFSDYCSCDGYINSPFTISIGAVDNCGRKPWYSEPCPGTFAVIYSSGESTGLKDKQIVTTDLQKQCTKKHTGTSAAAPLAAGIFALVLEANRKLTWRDLQHLIAKTSKVVSPDDRGWQTNGGGHKVNTKFGFGALDTAKLVDMASDSNWKTSKSQHICESAVKEVNLKKFTNQNSVESVIKSDGCSDMENCITKLEHVHVVVTLHLRRKNGHGQRGQHTITLTSPSGTKSDILLRRARDTSMEKGFENWEFLTVFHWDENPQGKWKLVVTDHSGTDWSSKMLKWHLKFYGTCDMKQMFNLHINETEICGTHCKSGCPTPKDFSKNCVDCSQYCDCTIGQCVDACDEHLVADNQLRHCRRSMEHQRYEFDSTSGEDDSENKAVASMSFSAKFAIICLALVLISVLVAGIAYCAAKMPNSKKLPKGYHSVQRYPCTEVAVEESSTLDREEHVTGDEEDNDEQTFPKGSSSVAS